MKEININRYREYKWDNEVLGYVAQIHEYKGRGQKYLEQKPFELNRLVELAKIKSTESSNKIEGIVTTSTRMKQLFAEKTQPRSRDEKEIMGYRAVLNTIHENYEYITISSSYILQLHQQLFLFSEKSIGGKYKNTQNYITAIYPDGKEMVLFTPLPPFETPQAVEELCTQFNLALSKGDIDPLLLIPIFILDFLCIHPFNDGNGRMSRLLTTLLLYRQGYEVGKYISLEAKIEQTKNDYYEVLNLSSRDWHTGKNDIMPFVKYILAIILAAYRDFESRVEILSNKVSALEIVVNAVNMKFGKFTKSDIMELCPTLSASTIEKSLKLMVDEGVIAKEGKGKNSFYIKL